MAGAWRIGVFALTYLLALAAVLMAGGRRSPPSGCSTTRPFTCSAPTGYAQTPGGAALGLTYALVALTLAAAALGALRLLQRPVGDDPRPLYLQPSVSFGRETTVAAERDRMADDSALRMAHA